MNFVSDEQLKQSVKELAEAMGKVVCDHTESCTQKLVVCEHQKLHSVIRYNTKLQCTNNGYCSVAEVECKCIKK